jgi:primase-polymerase (primpol)-like protein
MLTGQSQNSISPKKCQGPAGGVSLDLSKFPQELKAKAQWVGHTHDKTPINPKTGGNAQADNPETWGTFPQTVKYYEAHKENGIAGVGREFSFYDPYCGIDLDHCRDPETGEIEPWAWEIIKRFASYTEISPSGTGVHIWIKGKLPPGAENQKNLEGGRKIEVYDVGRYFTVTGQHLAGTPPTIQDRDKELKTFHAQVIAKPKPPTNSPGLSPTLSFADSEIIEKLRSAKNGEKFDRLWRGDISEYGGDDSGADLAFCDMVAFYTQDREQIDRLYRASALNRDKWDKRRGTSTYGAKTIEKALAGITETYQGPRSKLQDVQDTSPQAGSAQEAPKSPSQAKKNQAPKIPKIIITKKFLHHKSNEAIKALETANNPPFLFRRSGTLVRISKDERDHPRIETINDIQLRGILARKASFFKETEKGLVATSPPMDLVKDILALGEWNFPPLEGIIQTPAMRLDGTVLNEPGYDSQTRLFYVKPPDLIVPDIPKNPSQEAVKESLDYLLEIICDFPFVEDSDRANALGLLITLPLRPAIPGNIPMGVIPSPTPGTGKTLYAEVLALLGTGKVAAMAGFPRDDDEMRKFITSRLLAGDPLISFDNLELPLWGPSLSRALTCTEWEDRILGGNTTARLPQRAVWIANGNNLKMRGDLPRRTFPIRLDARLAKPWEREDFKHKNLCEWILRYRGDFLGAILTIARAWFVAGKPKPKKPVPVMGGFEGWAETIGGILAFAEVTSFLENLKEFHDQADLEGPEWESFLSAWIETIGESAKTCQEIAAVIKENEDFAFTLPDNLGDILKNAKKSFERSLGKMLAGKEKRPYGENNLALQRVRKYKGAILWKVAPLSR